MTDLAAVQDASSLDEALAARVREELSMPFLPTVFTLLGRHRRYLREAVDAFLAAPPNGVEDHARRCRRIGAEAAAAMVHTPLDLGPAASPIRALIDAYNRVNPPSLLFTLFLATGSSPPAVMVEPLPAPPSGDGTDELLADIRACHGGSRVPGFWRELVAGCPQLAAAAAWALVRRLPADARFAGAVEAIGEASRRALGNRRAPNPLELGSTSAQAERIAEVVALYQIVIPTMTVEIECLRRAVALGSAAGRPSMDARVR